jgi:gas vesicle protein
MEGGTNMEKSCNVYGRFFQGILAGGILGALVGIFFAPKSGKELRTDVREKSKEAQAFFEDAKHRATEWKEGAEHSFARIKGVFGKERVPEYTESLEGSEGTA